MREGDIPDDALPPDYPYGPRKIIWVNYPNWAASGSTLAQTSSNYAEVYGGVANYWEWGNPPDSRQPVMYAQSSASIAEGEQLTSIFTQVTSAH